MIDALSSDTVSLVKLALDVAQQNQKLISNNIANINSDNYSAMKVDFEKIFNEQLSSYLESGDVASIEHLRSEVASEQFIETELNRPTLESELINMSDNVLRYRTLLNALGARGEIMSMAIKTRSA